MGDNFELGWDDAAGTGGTYPITFTAANGALPNATQSFTLIVNQPPSFTSATTTTFAVGDGGFVHGDGLQGPGALALTGETPQVGVTFTPATGVLSGTPAVGTGGSYPLTFTPPNGVAPDAT